MRSTRSWARFTSASEYTVKLEGVRQGGYSTILMRGVRDPFIMRSAQGDKFYLLATDLKIYQGKGWDYEQRHGSRSLMVWESPDLVHWSAERSVDVAPPTAGNTWAPEAHWDAKTGQYVVYWASKLYPTIVRSAKTRLRRWSVPLK